MTGPVVAPVAPAADVPVATAAPVVRDTILSIQAMRALAAIAVAFYHAQLILAQPEYGGIRAGGFLPGLGWSGVNFFFVLSGFIIMYAHHADIGRPARLGRYAWRRVSRIYPIYWLCLSGYIAAAAIGLGHPDFRVTVPDMLSAYTLLPFTREPSLPIKVAWTLFYEVGFYVLFALLIVNRRLGVAAFAAWALGILLGGVVLGWTRMGLLHAWNSYFLIGAGLFLAYRRLPSRAGLPLLIAGVVLFALMALGGWVPNRIDTAQHRPLQLIALAVPFALVLLGGVLFERAGGVRPGRPLVLLGEASYSIYLVHSPVLSVLAGLHRKLAFGILPPLALFWLAAIVSIAAGVIAHLLLERPLLTLLRRVGRSSGIDAPSRREAAA